MNAKDQAFEKMLDYIMDEQGQMFARGHIEALIYDYMEKYHMAVSWEDLEEHVEEITGKPMTQEIYAHINLEIGWEGIDNDIYGFVEHEYNSGRLG